ncbi:galectin-8-like isoform X1 [Callorhinchus milii]|nr:galectin-8 isoform X1 [Callorhinchus milii]XP_042188714.1 galectin-8-like isoform X1 [Callorhinchus milii]|eukprot:gi/632952865/ref/XP_007892090.1/ PREDICTED: galectin-8 isoform X1 [Callorhinchus milii]
MSNQTVSNPVIPYTGAIFGGLLRGQMVAVQGVIPKNSERFQVDFQCGSSEKPRADVALHFNPRFRRSGCVVCNTLEHEKWGREEIKYEMPLKKGEPFEIIFLVLVDRFKVAVNGKHFLEYQHRISVNRVDTLGIYGTVHIQNIAFLGTSEQENPYSNLPIKRADGDNSQVKRINSPLMVPYMGKLKDGLSSGRIITIQGRVDKNPTKIAINLRLSESTDIPLHLKPNFKEKAFVRNSFLHQCWGEEELKIDCFPFSPSAYFEVIIYCGEDCFKVAVNGEHLLEYKYRFTNLSKIDTLEIDGDVELLDVQTW